MLLKLTHTNNRTCLVNSLKIQFALTYTNQYNDQEITTVVIKHVPPIKGLEPKGFTVEVKESFDEILGMLPEDHTYVRLKKYNGKSCYLVNIDQVETIHEVWDKTNNCYSTKISFNNGSTFINVDEDINAVHDKIYGIMSYDEEESYSFNSVMGY